MDSILKDIRDFADKAHGKQTRKYSPDRYIVHPSCVMEICSRCTNHKPVLAAALLHDVLEDTDTTKGRLHSFLNTVMKPAFADETLQLVVELTDVYVKADYPQWNRRKRKSMEIQRMEKISGSAQTIKYADIIDNCGEIIQEDPDFAPVFLKECKNLLEHLTKGNASLYKEAVSVVNNGLAALQHMQHAAPSDPTDKSHH